MVFGQFGIARDIVVGVATIGDVSFHYLGISGICCCLFTLVLMFGNRVICVWDEFGVLF